MNFKNLQKTDKLLLIAVLLVVCTIIISLILGVLLIRSMNVVPEVNVADTALTADELRQQGIESAKRMHIKGESHVTDEQLARMKAMNAVTVDLTDEERRTLLEAMQ